MKKIRKISTWIPTENRVPITQIKVAPDADVTNPNSKLFLRRVTTMPESWTQLGITDPEGIRDLSNLAPKEKLEFILNRFHILGSSNSMPGAPRGAGEYGPFRVPLDFSPQEALSDDNPIFGLTGIPEVVEENFPGWSGGYKKMLEIFEQEMKQYIPEVVAASMSRDVKEKLAQGQSWEYAIASLINVASGTTADKTLEEKNNLVCKSCGKESDDSWIFYHNNKKINIEQAKILLRSNQEVTSRHKTNSYPKDQNGFCQSIEFSSRMPTVMIAKNIIDTERHKRDLETGMDFDYMEKELASQIGEAAKKTGKDPWLKLYSLIDKNKYEKLKEQLFRLENTRGITGDRSRIPIPRQNTLGISEGNRLGDWVGNREVIDDMLKPIKESLFCRNCKGKGYITKEEAGEQKSEKCLDCDGTGSTEIIPQYLRVKSSLTLQNMHSLIKLANHLDTKGLFKEADELDNIIYYIYNNI